MSLGRAVSVAALIVLSSGCTGVYLADDIDLELNFSLLSGPSDELHLPYVKGTKVTLWARSTDSDDKESTFWLVSDNPSVLRVESQSRGRASCLAVGVGAARVLVYDGSARDELLYDSVVEVRAPTRAVLLAHGPLLLGRSEEEALTTSPHVLVDKQATFLVRYFDRDQQLYGNGVLQATATSLIDLEPDTTFLFENREWLRITPHAAGGHLVGLRAADVPLPPIEVIGIAESDVADLVLQGQDESAAEDGDWLTILARAYDHQDRPVYGAECTWYFDGAQGQELGDLFRYKYRAHSSKELRASLGDHQVTVRINASEGYVDSSNQLGCSAVPYAPSATPIVPLLAMAPLVLRVVRRREGH